MRLELTRKSDLALRVLDLLAASDSTLAGSVVATHVGTSASFLAQALAPLIERRWVDSRTGRNGGYRLCEAARTVSVLEVIEAIEGPIETGTCVLAGGPCGSEICALHSSWEKARAALRASLASQRAIGR